MLIGADEKDVGIGMAVNDRLELHFEAVVIAGELPRFEIVFLAVLSGWNMKSYVIQLVGFVIVKEHVFGCGGSIAEAVADVEAKWHAVYKS